MDAISLFKMKAEVKCWDLKLVLEPDSWKVFMLAGHWLSGGHRFTESISSSSSQCSRLLERREEKKMFVERAKEAIPPREKEKQALFKPAEENL